MELSVLAGSVLLVLTAAASWWAALRVAAAWGCDGWQRVAAAATVFATVAALVPLACGLVGLGTAPLVLAAVTIAVAAAAGAAAGRPEVGVLEAAGRSVGGAAPAARAAAGFSAACGAALLAHLLLRPEVRTDGYHLAEIVQWLHDGSPGSAGLVVHEWPAGAYSLTNELVLTWGIGIARSFGFAAVWTVALTVLLAACAYAFLRGRDVPAGGAALGAAVALLVTATVGTYDGVGTDLPSIAWLVCAAALLGPADARRRRLAPALLALGLAVGTKTTSGLTGAALLLLLAPALRHRLRASDAVATALAAALALPWPLRNLVEHGSPMWPFSSLGIGDPVPYMLSALQTTFWNDPAAAVRMYLELSTGDVLTAGLLMAAAGAVALLAPARDVRACVVLAFAGMAIWGASPITGPPPEFVATMAQASIRYGLPALLCAVAGLAIATRGPRPARAVASAALAACAAGCLYLAPLRVAATVADFWLVIVAGAAGAAVAIVRPVALPRGPVAASAAGVALAVALTLSAPRYMHPRVGLGADVGGVLRWLSAQPRFQDGAEPVVSTWRPDGRLAGDTLAHPVRLLPREASCEAVRARARDGWVVVRREQALPSGATPAPGEACFRGRAWAYRDPLYVIYTDPA